MPDPPEPEGKPARDAITPQLPGSIFTPLQQPGGSGRWYGTMRWVRVFPLLTAGSPEEIVQLAGQYEKDNPRRAEINHGVWN